MKALLVKSSISFFISLFFISLVQAQEYDDIYFRKSDRQKSKELRTKQSPSYGRDSYLYDEIEKFEGSDNDGNTLSDYRQSNQSEEDLYKDNNTESPVVEKHYYYNQSTSRYDRYFDDIFWSDPYLYQGTIFDPSLNYYGNRSSSWRPGWSVSISVGNRWNRSRWRNRYWDRYDYGGYNSYGYYGSSSNYGYYDNYWCPPIYSNRGNVIVYSNQSGGSRGVTRGRRSSRNSSIYNRERGDSGRSGRIISGGGSNIEDKSNRNSSRYSNNTNTRTYRNSNQTYNRNSSTPRRRTTNSGYNSNNTNSRNSNPRTYSNGNSGSNSRSNTYRSGSRSSSNSGSRSTNISRPSRSSSNSKPSSPSRSSRTKRGN